MLPEDIKSREEGAWRDLVERLDVQLASLWPEMQERLADRYRDFLDHAVEKARQHQFGYAASVARYVNLCIVWGPSFQDRPGFEWARGLLVAPHSNEWLTVHQLVRRSIHELQLRADARIESEKLAAVDAQLLDQFDRLGRVVALPQEVDSHPLPRVACDLEAVELRLINESAPQVYALDAGDWRRIPAMTIAPVRIALNASAPPLICVLTPPRSIGNATLLQVRLRSSAICDADWHPAVRFAGSHGRWEWRGYQTRAVSWPVQTLDQPGPATGPGSAIAEETTPDVYLLDLEACGLRDEGDVLGSIRRQVWAWPATQWWIEIQRTLQAPQAHLPKSPADIVRGETRCKVEADGIAQDAAGLQAGFSQGLELACAKAMDQLISAWGKLDGIMRPELEGTMGMLLGRAAFTWGWHHGNAGLGQRAFMRVQGLIDMKACSIDLQMRGDLKIKGAHARICLRLLGDIPFARQVDRVSDSLPLIEAVLPLVARVDVPVMIELEPLAEPAARMLVAVGPFTGALTGEVGLRPRLSGGSGWEWFVRLRLEPVRAFIAVSDPLSGVSTEPVSLLPALPLIDWSLG
jgi:hypothetical protein